MMPRRMEDKIRQLCQRAIAEQDPEQFTKIVVELRETLHTQIKTLRQRIAAANLLERRASADSAVLARADHI